MKLNNKYFILRHGEALSNVKEIVSSWPEKFKNQLTKNGVLQIKSAADELREKNIDLIFASPLLRTKQTAEIISKQLKIRVRFDKRLKEIAFGIFSGGPAKSFVNFFENRLERIKKGAPKGESYTDVSKRMILFFKETNNKYKGKNILIISHQAPLFLLEGYIMGLSTTEIIKKFPKERMLRKGQIKELN